LSAKTKIYFATAVALWDAEFYVKVDDDVHVNIGKTSFFLVPFSECSEYKIYRAAMKFETDNTDCSNV